MAVDDALAEGVAGGGAAAIRVYRWAPPCLSLGRNQPARGHYDSEGLAARGVEVVRRPTGGRAVLHDQELTYSVVVPEGILGGPRASYAAINRGIVSGLRRLGVAASVQPSTGRRATAPSLAPCFGDAAEGEVMIAGRKLVGSAQRHHNGVLLQHGSLPLQGDASPPPDALRAPGPAADKPEASVSLGSLCDPLPTWAALVAALRAGWEEALGIRLVDSPLLAVERQRAEVIAEGYRDPAWTWHR